jgi:glycosyltransferase involved in cell wall biosynthesis
MRILLVHNNYQQRGGEDSVFEAERDLLSAAGHEVSTQVVSNSVIADTGSALRAAAGTVYNFAARRMIANAIRSVRPDVVHVHNFFPLLSPAIFDACAAEGVGVVLTLHNFRLACASGMLLRNGQPCEDCIGRMPWRAVRHRCYRNSGAGSAVVAAMISWHSFVGTWDRKVDRFIALTDFARDLFVRAGLPADRIAVKPNFAPEAAVTVLPATARRGFVFVGRLSPEKGIACLIEAWRDCCLPLTIVGGGPLEDLVRAAADANPAIKFVGQQPPERVFGEMSVAKAVLVPSTCYENFPLTVAEAFAHGTPVIASRLGGLQRLIADGQNGFLFTPGGATELRAAVERTSVLDGFSLNAMISFAHAYYVQHLTPAASLAHLTTIYSAVIDRPRASSSAVS